MGKGKFIVIDGPEGAGKTTQLGMLKHVLPHRYGGHYSEFVFTREPGGTPFAEDTRNLVLGKSAASANGVELIQAYGAARFNHVRTLVLPALFRGAVVVCDRFDAITFAYQVVAQEGGQEAEDFFDFQRRELESMFTRASEELWSTIILHVDVGTTLARVLARGGAGNHFDTRAPEFYARALEGFRAYKRRYPARTFMVDGSLTPALVNQDVIGAFDRILGGPAPLG